MYFFGIGSIRANRSPYFAAAHRNLRRSDCHHRWAMLTSGVSSALPYIKISLSPKMSIFYLSFCEFLFDVLFFFQNRLIFLSPVPLPLKSEVLITSMMVLMFLFIEIINKYLSISLSRYLTSTHSVLIVCSAVIKSIIVQNSDRGN